MIAIISLIVTFIATVFAGYQLLQFNKQNELNIRRTEALYIQKIKRNHLYILNNVRRFEKTLMLISRGSSKEEYLQSLHIIGYYITSICNEKFEEVIKEQIEFTEEFIKLNTASKKLKDQSLLNAHKDLLDLHNLIKNSNYLISLFYPLSYDEALKKDIRNLYDKDINFKVYQKNILYYSPGNPNSLGYATPMMYYGSCTSKLMENYGIKPDNVMDLPIITINEFSEKGDYKSLMNSLNIKDVLQLTDKINYFFQSLIESDSK